MSFDILLLRRFFGTADIRLGKRQNDILSGTSVLYPDLYTILLVLHLFLPTYRRRAKEQEDHTEMAEIFYTFCIKSRESCTARILGIYLHKSGFVHPRKRTRFCEYQEFHILIKFMRKSKVETDNGCFKYQSGI